VCLFDIGSGCRSHNNDNVHYVFTIPPQHLVSKNKFKISSSCALYMISTF
jgi:hypothetical protein